jgi:hypothetical protein
MIYYVFKAIEIVIGIVIVLAILMIITHVLSKVQMRSWLSEADKFLNNKYHKLKKEEHDVQKN